MSNWIKNLAPSPARARGLGIVRIPQPTYDPGSLAHNVRSSMLRPQQPRRACPGGHPHWLSWQHSAERYYRPQERNTPSPAPERGSVFWAIPQQTYDFIPCQRTPIRSCIEPIFLERWRPLWPTVQRVSLPWRHSYVFRREQLVPDLLPDIDAVLLRHPSSSVNVLPIRQTFGVLRRYCRLGASDEVQSEVVPVAIFRAVQNAEKCTSARTCDCCGAVGIAPDGNAMTTPCPICVNPLDD